MRLARPHLLVVTTLLAACTGASDADGPALADAEVPRVERMEHLLSTIAADSMQGRRSGTRGAELTASFLAAELERYGVEPGMDDGFLQPVPLVRVERNGQDVLTLPSEDLDFDSLDPSRVLEESNVVGIIRGSDPMVAGEVVVIGAHFDHVGIGQPVEGDSIYNGADDDGTGTVAVLEIARDLAQGEPPRRTVVVLLSTAEESGLLGTRWYIDHPVVPLEQTVADFQIEMIGRPDDVAGGFGHGWLTGYERTTMGDQLAAAGSPIVADTRLDMQFFFRSDNLPFAIAGIPAHTLSSYNMHEDYHQPSDEVELVDFAHMAALVDAAVEAVRFLADGPTPEWKEGGREGLPVR